MKWNNKTKEIIQYASAVFMLLFAVGLIIAAFSSPPIAQIHDSILYIFLQCLLYAASVFSITLYVNHQLAKIKSRLTDKDVLDIIEDKDEDEEKEKKSEE